MDRLKGRQITKKWWWWAEDASRASLVLWMRRWLVRQSLSLVYLICSHKTKFSSFSSKSRLKLSLFFVQHISLSAKNIATNWLFAIEAVVLLAIAHIKCSKYWKYGYKEKKIGTALNLCFLLFYIFCSHYFCAKKRAFCVLLLSPKKVPFLPLGNLPLNWPNHNLVALCKKVSSEYSLCIHICTFICFSFSTQRCRLQ